MDTGVLALMIPIIAITGAFATAMLGTYLKHKERMVDHMSGDQIAELERMSKIADILDRRVNVLENILDDEIPEWRETHGKSL